MRTAHLDPSSDLRVVVAAHKPYWMPQDDAFLPVQVGSAGKASIRNYQRDDHGDNISAKNANYCELTGLYWAWKNLSTPYLGLAHYRRHFAAKHMGDKHNRVATGEHLCSLLDEHSVILPNPRHYVIETNWSQYAHAHHEIDLVTTKSLIEAACPAYLSSFDEIMNLTSGHRFNMFVMRRDIADEYCDWLFGLLFALEERLDIHAYSQNDARVFGFVAERLLDVWIHAKKFPYVEMPVVNLESQHWVRKGLSFVGRKLRPKRA